MKSKIKIAIVHPSPNAYSETFIRNHIEQLPCEVLEMSGGFLPTTLINRGIAVPLVSKREEMIGKIWSKLLSSNVNQNETAIKSVLKKYKIQAVLAEYGPTGVAMMPICKELGIPLIVHFHGYDAHRKDIIKLHNNYKELFDNASAVVAVSKKMYSTLLGLGCPENKLHYIVYGVADIFFSSKKDTQNSKTILTVGRFTPKKAPYLTLMAFAEAVKQVPSARLKMIGTGTELLDTCWQLIKLYNLEDKVELLGTLNPKEVANHLNSACAFAQHSVESMDGDCEGTPNAVLEAGAMGLPVISTRHAGISDVVIHEHTGLLCDERDVQTMAANMIKVLKDADYARQLGVNAQKHILENYHTDISIKKLTDVIKNVVK